MSLRGSIPRVFKAFATSGYVAVLPDYLGLGDSPVFPVPSCGQRGYIRCGYASRCRDWCADNGVALKDRLFLTGYSQGGHATLAALREMESVIRTSSKSPPALRVPGRMICPGQPLRMFFRAAPCRIRITSSTFSRRIGMCTTCRNIWSPYDQTIPPLLDGTHSGEALNAILPADPTLTPLPSPRDEFATNPDHPIPGCLRKNDLLDWTPRSLSVCINATPTGMSFPPMPR